MSVGTLKIVYRDPRSLKGYPRNSRLHTKEQILAIGRSIREFGFVNPVLLKDDNTTIGAGHARVLAAIAEGLDKVPTVSLKGLSDAQWRAYIIADNALAEKGSSWSPEMLKFEFGELKSLDFDLTLTGFSLDEIKAVEIDGLPHGQSGAGSLADRFMVAPFSVLNAREGWWQDRKRAWLALGIQSEIGRGDTAVNSPHEGHGMADGLVAVRAKQKASRVDTNPGGGGRTALTASSAGRLPNATPSGSLMPAADYSKRQRGDGKGRAIG